MTIFETAHSICADNHHSKLSRLVQNIQARLADHQNRRRLRNELANLSNQILRDVGLTRHDV